MHGQLQTTAHPLPQLIERVYWHDFPASCKKLTYYTHPLFIVIVHIFLLNDIFPPSPILVQVRLSFYIIVLAIDHAFTPFRRVVHLQRYLYELAAISAPSTLSPFLVLPIFPLFLYPCSYESHTTTPSFSFLWRWVGSSHASNCMHIVVAADLGAPFAGHFVYG